MRPRLLFLLLLIPPVGARAQSLFVDPHRGGVSLTSGAFASGGYGTYALGVGVSPVGTFDVDVAVSRQPKSHATTAALSFTGYPGKVAPHPVYPEVTAGIFTATDSSSRGFLFGAGFHGWLVRSPHLQVIPEMSAAFSVALAGLGNGGSSKPNVSAGVGVHVACQPTSHLIVDLEPAYTRAQSQSKHFSVVGAQLSLVLL